MEILNSIGNLLLAVWQHMKQNKLSLFYLVVFIFVFYFIYGVIQMYNNKKYIEDHWAEYKCKPYMMPFSSMFSKVGPIENFNDCLWINYRSAFSLLMKPILYVSSIITQFLGDMAFTINKFRHMGAFIREVFQKMIAEVFDKLTTSMSTLQFYQEKFRNLMKKQFATFQLIYFYLETMRASFESLFNGPLPVMLLFLMIFGILAIFLVVMCGLCAASIPFFSWFVACPICLICFEPSSQIRINQDTTKSINDIQLGDIIYPNQKVLGKLVFNLDYDYPVYQLEKGVYVSDSHLYYMGADTDTNIYNLGKNPVRISEFKHRLEPLFTRKLVCLATSDNLLYSPNHILADYTEVSGNCQLDNDWNNRVLTSLNSILDYKDYPVKSYSGYPGGFLNKVGDIEYLIEENDIELYDYCGIICSGNNIVWENNLWIRVSTSPKAIKYTGAHNNIVYHTKTDTGILRMNGLYFRDFLETTDTTVYEWWNSISPKYVQTISV